MGTENAPLKSHKGILSVLTLFGVIFTAAMPASAQVPPAVERFSVSFGAFQADPNFNGSLNTPQGNLQSDDLNLGKETMPHIRANIQIFYSDDALAPLLETGLCHGISHNIRMFADATGVKKLDRTLTGEIYNAALGVEWFPIKNVGVGLEYGKSQINLNRNDSVSKNFKLDLQGPSAFARFRY